MATIERRRNGRIADQDALFAKAAAAFLNPAAKERRGEMLRLLISSNHFLPFLCARTDLTVEQTAELLRAAMPLLPSVDLKLARHLCDERYNMDRETLLRFLQALACVSDARRISSTLLPLIRDSDARVRSKAARLVNIADDEKAWREAEADPRVLANLVEALWHIETPHRRKRYWKAVTSTSPRVAGNALIGLYLLGDPEARSLIIRMADHPSPEFRRTAVWAMGETGDTGFLDRLSELIGRETGAVRANVLRSLARIRKRANAAQVARGSDNASAGLTQ